MSNLEFRKFDWNGPKKVQTPNIEEDINNFLGSEILEKWKKSINTNLREKIVFVAERLDFISHQKSIAMIVRRKSKQTIKKLENNILQVNYECKIFGHNYGGLQFDIEALDYYLHLSCIDAIQSQPTYNSAFKWLKENIERYTNKTSTELTEIFKQDETSYNDLYGLRKNFIKAFVEDISSVLQDRICDTLIVVKAKKGEVTKESFEDWNKRTKKEKLKKIADKLYELRSLFTHKNIRSFLPVSTLISIPNLDGEYLLCKKFNPMDLLLDDIIKELCFNVLQKDEMLEK